MNLTDSFKIIETIGLTGIDYLFRLGYIPGGNNGPYDDPETPVRNTSHYIRIFSYLYRTTNDIKYKKAVEYSVKYITSKESLPFSRIFHIRKDPNKDFSNGVIGQAWVIEGLIEAAKLLGDLSLLELAKSNFLAHPFDRKLKLWRIVNLDGSYNQIDWTFNHQLWFAAIGTELNKYVHSDAIHNYLNEFYQILPNYFNVYRNGLIKHHIHTSRSNKEKFVNIVKSIRSTHYKLRYNQSLEHKETGYHAFNLYALAIIKENLDLELFQSKKFNLSLKYLYSDHFKNNITNNYQEKDITRLKSNRTNIPINIYGLPYNPVGFELPYIANTFSLISSSELVKDFYGLQLKYTRNKKNILDYNTNDPLTLNARVYELLRYLDS